jgi:hypothetical protein
LRIATIETRPPESAHVCACDHRRVAGDIAPRSLRSWLAILSRLAAVAALAVGLLVGGRSSWWVLLGCAAGLAILPVAWRRKAAVVPGATFATSADYLPGGRRRGKFAGELSLTPATLTWNPSRHSRAKGVVPLTLALADCKAVSMRAGSALLDVIITVRRRDGDEWTFLTHRSPRLRRAIAKLDCGPDAH